LRRERERRVVCVCLVLIFAVASHLLFYCLDDFLMTHFGMGIIMREKADGMKGLLLAGWKTLFLPNKKHVQQNVSFIKIPPLFLFFLSIGNLNILPY
jgi:hypothetical protein